MLKVNEIAIVSGARTPMADHQAGKLRSFTAQELGAIAGKCAIQRAGLDPQEFDHCVMGNAQQTSGDALYGARHVALKAGLPIETPALTVNRLCGSGMQAIVSAAQMMQLGEAKVVLAGGMESMSQAPHVIRGARYGLSLGEGKLEDSLMVALLDTQCGLYMANTAELYADDYRKHGGFVRFVSLADFPYVVTKDGRVTAILPIDALSWTRETATGFTAVTGAKKGLAPNTHGELRITGMATAMAKQELKVRGWTVLERQKP